MKGPSTALQILTAVEDGPVTAEDMLSICGVSASHLYTILSGLVRMGELTKDFEVRGIRTRTAVYSKPSVVDGKPPTWARSVWDWGTRA